MSSDYAFTLPRGYRDDNGEVHRQGTMRLALAIDEIEALSHPRVQVNEAYLALALLSRVITRLGTLAAITPAMLEQLLASDLAYLQDLYLQLNSGESVTIGATCPACQNSFPIQTAPLG